METTGKLPVHIRLALDSIEDSAMAISGISRMVYELKLDGADLSEEVEQGHPGMVQLCKGLHDTDLARALEVMAESIKGQADDIKRYLERHFS